MIEVFTYNLKQKILFMPYKQKIKEKQIKKQK